MQQELLHLIPCGGLVLFPSVVHLLLGKQRLQELHGERQELVVGELPVVVLVELGHDFLNLPGGTPQRKEAQSAPRLGGKGQDERQRREGLRGEEGGNTLVGESQLSGAEDRLELLPVQDSVAVHVGAEEQVCNYGSD